MIKKKLKILIFFLVLTLCPLINADQIIFNYGGDNELFFSFGDSELFFFGHDLTPPTINIINPIDGETYYSDGSGTKYINFNINASDYDGVDTMWYSIDGGTNIIFDGDELVGHMTKKMYFVVFCVNDTLNNVNCSSISYTYSYIASSGTTTFIDNPKDMTIDLSTTWVQGTKEYITLTIHNKYYEIYSPETQLNFTIDGIRVDDIRTDEFGRIVYEMEIGENAELGNHKINIFAIDEHIIEEEIIVKIIKKKLIDDAFKEFLVNKYNELRTFIYIVTGSLILISFIFLIIFLMKKDDKN